MAYSCNATHQYQQALYWCDRYEELVHKYERLYSADEDYIDKQLARCSIYRATALVSLGQSQESYLAYLDFRNTKFSKSPEGIYDAGEYLIEAKQWKDAAVCFQRLDELVNKYRMEFSIENLETYYLKKYEANLKAGRKDSVYAISTFICDSLSVAIDRARADNAAELATIYNTEQNETRLAENKAKLMRERQIAAVVTIILIIGFFIVYALYKQKAAAKLHKAHNELKAAYDQLEETTSAKGVEFYSNENHRDSRHRLSMRAHDRSCDNTGIHSHLSADFLSGHSRCLACPARVLPITIVIFSSSLVKLF